MASRPRYESAVDRDNEQFIMACLPELNLYKVPYTYGYDFFGKNRKGGTLVAELKCPKCPLTAMKNGCMILSLHKFTDCVNAPVDTAILLVKAYDGLWVTDMRSTHKTTEHGNLVIEMNGRSNRDDPQDWEPCVIFPVSEFKQILNPEQMAQLHDEFLQNQSISAETLRRVRKTADLD